VWAAFQITVGLGLLTWLLSGVELDRLRTLFAEGDHAKLVVGSLLLLAALPLLQAWRLHVLVVPYTRRLGTSVQVFFVGAFFNNVLPSNLGGDAVRLLYLRRMATSSWGGPLAMLLLHRASSFAVLAVGALVSVPLRHDAITGAFLGESTAPAWLVPAAGALAVCAGIAIGALALWPRAHTRIAAVTRRLARESAAALGQTSRQSLAVLAVLTALFHLARMAGVVVLLDALGTGAHPLDVWIALAVSGFAVVLPLSIGGLGVMEGALSMTLVAFGADASAAIAVALVNRTVLLLNAAIGGGVYLASRRDTRPR
jgi:hypothetical protein